MGASITGCLRDALIVTPQIATSPDEEKSPIVLALPRQKRRRAIPARQSRATSCYTRPVLARPLAVSAPAQTRRYAVCIAVIEADTIDQFWSTCTAYFWLLSKSPHRPSVIWVPSPQVKTEDPWSYLFRTSLAIQGDTDESSGAPQQR